MLQLGRALLLCALACALPLTAAAGIGDHLRCYKVRDTLKPSGFVDLATALMVDESCKIERARNYCVSGTASDYEVVVDGRPFDPMPISGRPADAVRVCYEVKCKHPAITREVSDSFGHRSVTIKKDGLICTPAVEGPTELLTEGVLHQSRFEPTTSGHEGRSSAVRASILLDADDHLRCYRVDDALDVEGTVLVDARLPTTERCEIRRTEHYCVPATASYDGVTVAGRAVEPVAAFGAPDDQSRLCYRVRCQAAPAPEDVSDPLGHRIVMVRKDGLLCTPAIEGVPPVSTTTTTPAPTTSTLPETSSTLTPTTTTLPETTTTVGAATTTTLPATTTSVEPATTTTLPETTTTVAPTTTLASTTTSTLATGTAEAYVSITRTGSFTASTYKKSAFAIENRSADLRIVRFSLDLSSALFPDMLFDPNGVAGDVVAKCVEADTGAAAVGYLAPPDACASPFSGARDDGYEVVELAFGDFDAGETFTFSVDVDPTSIRGASDVAVAGAVSGLELAGATATVEFDDGTVLSAEPFRVPATNGGAEALVKPGAPSAPSIAMLGVASTPALVTGASKTLRITGPPGAAVRLLRIEGALALDETAGYEVEPFEANTSVSVAEHAAVIGAGGTVDVVVTLTRDATNAGINVLTAALVDPDGSGRTGATSVPIVVQLACSANAQCDDHNACTANACSAGECSNPAHPAGTACSGGTCDGAGACVVP